MLNSVSTATSATDQARRGVELVEAARGLVPMIAAAAGRIEKEREIPAEVIEAMHAARLFRMLIPASIGGEEVEPATFFQVMEAIASADASLAWCLGQNSGVSMAAAYLDPKVARELFGDAARGGRDRRALGRRQGDRHRRRLSRDRALAVRERQPAFAMARRPRHHLRAGRQAAARPERQAA